jgi:hypothetical protein
VSFWYSTLISAQSKKLQKAVCYSHGYTIKAGGCYRQVQHLEVEGNRREVAIAPGDVDERGAEDGEGEGDRVQTIDDPTMRQIHPAITEDQFRMAIVGETKTTQ